MPRVQGKSTVCLSVGEDLSSFQRMRRVRELADFGEHVRQEIGLAEQAEGAWRDWGRAACGGFPCRCVRR